MIQLEAIVSYWYYRHCDDQPMYVGIYAQKEHKQSLLSIIRSWVLSFLYMTGDKTRAGPPYTPRMWKDEKTLKFMYCGKGLGGKGASVSKEKSDETQELQKTCFWGDEFVSQVDVSMGTAHPTRQPSQQRVISTACFLLSFRGN